jgi:hypothetical protein
MYYRITEQALKGKKEGASSHFIGPGRVCAMEVGEMRIPRRVRRKACARRWLQMA